MVAKLSDKQKKQMIADYLDCENYSAVARKYEVSRTTVKKVVESDGEIGKKLKGKQEENTQDILRYMEEKKQKACEIIDAYLNAMLLPEKIEGATVNQLSVALATVIDKFTRAHSEAEESGGTGVIILPEAKK